LDADKNAEDDNPKGLKIYIFHILNLINNELSFIVFQLKEHYNIFKTIEQENDAGLIKSLDKSDCFKRVEFKAKTVKQVAETERIYGDEEIFIEEEPMVFPISVDLSEFPSSRYNFNEQIISDKIKKDIKSYPVKLLKAFYYERAVISELLCYLIVILIMTLNGGITSLVYFGLIISWGLLSAPWPTMRFWLTIMFYTICVIIIKYVIQFFHINWPGEPEDGLYWPRVLGIDHDHFFSNCVWDVLLLMSLFIHRGILKVSPYLFYMHKN